MQRGGSFHTPWLLAAGLLLDQGFLRFFILGRGETEESPQLLDEGRWGGGVDRPCGFTHRTITQTLERWTGTREIGAAIVRLEVPAEGPALSIPTPSLAHWPMTH